MNATSELGRWTPMKFETQDLEYRFSTGLKILMVRDDGIERYAAVDILAPGEHGDTSMVTVCRRLRELADVIENACVEAAE